MSEMKAPVDNCLSPTRSDESLSLSDSKVSDGQMSNSVEAAPDLDQVLANVLDQVPVKFTTEVTGKGLYSYLKGSLENPDPNSIIHKRKR
jgi:hypothetical protein